MNKTETLTANLDRVLRQFYDGVTMTQIAKENGCSSALVGKFLRSKGVDMPEDISVKNALKKDDVIKLHQDGKAVKEIVELLDMKENTVRKFLRQAGFKLSTATPLEPIADQIIADYHSGLGCFKLSKKYNSDESSILKLLKRHNVEIRGPERTHEFDEHFFDVIDTPEKAYILGLLAADGSVDRYSVRLSMIDYDIVEKCAKIIGYNGPISEPKMRGKSKHQMYMLRLNSAYLTERLNKLGLVNNKTYILPFPTEDQIPRYLIRHWIRGFHDGDGSLIAPTAKGNRYLFKFIGLPNVIRGIEKVITEELGFPVSVFKTTNTKIEMLNLACGTRSYVKKFLDWIYQDSTIHMDRKYQRYQEFLKWDQETPKHMHNI